MVDLVPGQTCPLSDGEYDGEWYNTMVYIPTQDRVLKGWTLNTVYRIRSPNWPVRIQVKSKQPLVRQVLYDRDEAAAELDDGGE